MKRLDTPESVRERLTLPDSVRPIPQTRMADLLGVTRQHYRKWVSGSVVTNPMRSFCHFLHLAIDANGPEAVLAELEEAMKSHV